MRNYSFFVVTPLWVVMTAVACRTVHASEIVTSAAPETAYESTDEVIVTGSRLSATAEVTAQPVHVYSREQIDRSGQTTVASFLNTLPLVSTSITESGTAGQTLFAGTTVTLRGMPIGTTLILVNGQRVESSGNQSQSDFFDLNNIPLGAVERIEIIADGSSAIYGSDAIAGVVNLILRKDLEGLEINTRYGRASGIDETNLGVAFGKTWSRGTVSVVGSYQRRGELLTEDRRLTQSNDYSALGGANNNFPICRPGNVFSIDGTPLPGAPAGSAATFASVSGSVTEGPASLGDFGYGALNECSIAQGVSLIPPTRRSGLFVQGHFGSGESLELFAELLYSHVQQDLHIGYQSLFGLDGFQSYTVGPDNPYNPFGTTVGVALSIPDVRQSFVSDTDFYRPLLGMRGEISNRWRWELAAIQAEDRTRGPQRNVWPDSLAIQSALNASDPLVALNPFVAGSPGAASFLDSLFTDGLRRYKGQDRSVNGFIRGDLLPLPAGPVTVVVGGEFLQRSLVIDNVDDGFNPPSSRDAYRRNGYSVFAEARIPIVPDHYAPAGSERLALRLAGRRDHSNDFGTETTPQLGLEWRATRALLLRANYAESYKAPSLSDLNSPAVLSPVNAVIDPQNGGIAIVPVLSGGNPELQPLSGESYTAGFLYQSLSVPTFRLSATYWHIEENDAIQNVLPQFIVDNESYFPGRVTRDNIGTITLVDDTRLNFGTYEIAGVDYQLEIPLSDPSRGWSASISATQTQRYRQQLTPSAPAISAVSAAQQSGSWAPRWKGMTALSWVRPTQATHLAARYTGRYEDYDGVRTLGNFWLVDASYRYEIGQSLLSRHALLKGASADIGGINLFNRSPQFSAYGGQFVGYDPTQEDIRGRYLYVKLGFSW